MNRKKYLKMTMLFLLILCISTMLIVIFRNVYFTTIQDKLIQNIEQKLEKIVNTQIVVEEEPYFLKGEEKEIGLIIIPSLNIKAPICEGTSNNVLKYAVGHFIQTGLWNGNIVLASHNRGSYAHYFSKISELKNGAEIIYITDMGERRYIVTESKVIEETNVEVLKNTDENTITLITCITGQRNKRRCVIAKQY